MQANCCRKTKQNWNNQVTACWAAHYRLSHQRVDATKIRSVHFKNIPHALDRPTNTVTLRAKCHIERNRPAT
jgi:hypothetical protein